MTPPIPSISVTPRRSLAARQYATSTSNGIERRSRLAAMSGDNGAAKRHGLTASRFFAPRSSPCARNSNAVSLPSGCAASKPEATGFNA